MGVTGKTAYHTFAFQDFQANPEQFAFKIGSNQFDGRHISLNIHNAEGQISGEIKLGKLNP
jgi:hypothetical protein